MTFDYATQYIVEFIIELRTRYVSRSSSKMNPSFVTNAISRQQTFELGGAEYELLSSRVVWNAERRGAVHVSNVVIMRVSRRRPRSPNVLDVRRIPSIRTH